MSISVKDDLPPQAEQGLAHRARLENAETEEKQAIEVPTLTAEAAVEAVRAAADAGRAALRERDAHRKRVERAAARLLMEQQREAHVAAAAAAATATAQQLDELRTIGAAQLGLLLGRSTMMIRVDATRRPGTLPPRFVIPGTRKLTWRIKDVKEWMDALAEMQADERAEQVRLAQTQRIAAVSRQVHSRSGRRHGTATTDRSLTKKATREGK